MSNEASLVEQYYQNSSNITELAREAAGMFDFLLKCQDQFVPGGGDMLEIGVCRAGTAVFLSSFLKPEERIFLVDPYQNVESNRSTITSFTNVDPNRLVFIKEDSLEVNRKKEREFASLEPKVRFAHIDGEHSYDAVIADLELAIRFLLPGGLIVLDDIFNINSACCTHALFDFLNENKRYQCIALGFGKAYLCESKYLGHYNQAFLLMPEVLQKSHQLHVRLCFNSWAGERTYLSFSQCNEGEPKYQVIGRRFATLNDALASRPGRH